jgi:hypothetical protein
MARLGDLVRAKGVVAQRDPVQCAQRITRGELTRRGRDQRVHQNPATLVTLTVRCPLLVYLTITNRHRNKQEVNHAKSSRFARGMAEGAP